jgi:DNA-binding NarL/FixJ family response regulator
MTDWLDIPTDDLPKALPKQKRAMLNITDRQLQILQLIVLGKSNKEIARLFNCKDRTIESHRLVMRPRGETITQLAIRADRLFREV